MVVKDRRIDKQVKAAFIYPEFWVFAHLRRFYGEQEADQLEGT